MRYYKSKTRFSFGFKIVYVNRKYLDENVISPGIHVQVGSWKFKWLF